jgi:hypothetical protein
MAMDIQGRKDTLGVVLDTLKRRAAVGVVEKSTRVAVEEGMKIEEDITAIEDQGQSLTPGVEAIDHIDAIPLIVSMAQGLGIVQDLEKGSIHVKESRIDLGQGVFQGLGIHEAALQTTVIPSAG